MNASSFVRTARTRAGLSQGDLARRAVIPQPMLSSIERGLQDPRYRTLDRLLRECGQDLLLIPRPGRGVDQTQFAERLRLTPAARLRATAAAARGMRRFRKSVARRG
jgi:transcriptional regulator with XRE-family HTH domain